jgi:hypothetical protein
MCEVADFSLNKGTVFQKRTVFFMPEQAAEPPRSLGSMISLFLSLGDTHEFQISRTDIGLLCSHGFGWYGTRCATRW